MPRPNRIQPDGTFLATPHLGAFMGNRGCLHDTAGAISRQHQGKRWITCTLREKPGRGAVPQATAGRYTPLFFHDEATACAAGHRPCAECRRAVYDDFRAAWARAFGHVPKATEIDATLHAARLDPLTKRPRRHHAPLDSLPDGTFLLLQDQPHLVQGDHLLAYTAQGYSAPVRRPQGSATILTPEPLVQVMRHGWHPVLDPAADRTGW